jgi:hypothetical protein
LSRVRRDKLDMLLLGLISYLQMYDYQVSNDYSDSLFEFELSDVIMPPFTRFFRPGDEA